MAAETLAQPKLEYGNLAHPLEHPEFWQDPGTGLYIPKRIEGKYGLKAKRGKLWDDCLEDELKQETTLGLCARSFLFWCNLFVWTFVQFDSSAEGSADEGADRLMMTWPVQDDLALAIIDAATNKRDLCVDKSRDMGASWVALLVFLWWWLFRPKTALKMLSWKESYVDAPGDPDSLFWKLDYALKRLPPWMIPKFRRTHMHLENLENGSVIDGEATGQNVTRAGRRYAVLFDEAAAIPRLKEAMRAAADATKCRILVSTPAGPGAYSDLRFCGMPVQVLGYWDHPDKGKGRELKFHPGLERVVWCSPWLDSEIARRKGDRKDIAQNILIDHETSGSMVFDSSVINHQLATYAVSKPRVGRLEYIGPKSLGRHEAIKNVLIQHFRFVDDSRGKLRLWCDLKDGRPDQSQPWAMGIDVSTGVASSNSVIAIGNANLRTKCADFRSGTDSPDQLAEMAALLGYWFGGPAKRAFISFEANGPGQRFGQALDRSMRYPWIDRHRPEGKTQAAKPTKGLGWTSSEQAKETILQELRADMAAGTFINHSPEGLQQASRYVYFETGGIGPASLEHESADAWATHGDDVIADAVLNRGMKRMPRVQPEEFKAPRGSAAWAFARHEKAEAEEDE